MSVRPLHDRLLVRRIDVEERGPGGIIIPDTAKEKPQFGEVVAAGPGKRLNSGATVPLEVRVGDRIVFGKFAGTDVVLDAEDYLILREDEVFAILESAVDARKAA
jgi:chaperonin GroES